MSLTDSAALRLCSFKKLLKEVLSADRVPSVSKRSFTLVTTNSLNAGPCMRLRSAALRVASDTTALLSCSVGSRPCMSSVARRNLDSLGSSVTSVKKLA